MSQERAQSIYSETLRRREHRLHGIRPDTTHERHVILAPYAHVRVRLEPHFARPLNRVLLDFIVYVLCAEQAKDARVRSREQRGQSSGAADVTDVVAQDVRVDYERQRLAQEHVERVSEEGSHRIGSDDRRGNLLAMDVGEELARPILGITGVQCRQAES